jgi:hypothetical protein
MNKLFIFVFLFVGVCDNTAAEYHETHNTAANHNDFVLETRCDWDELYAQDKAKIKKTIDNRWKKKLEPATVELIGTQWMNYYRPEVLELIDQQLKKELQPNIVDIFFNELRFKNEVNNAVITLLPTILSRHKDDYIRPYIRAPLIDIVNNNIHIQNALEEQTKQYHNTIITQKNEFNRLIGEQQTEYNVAAQRYTKMLEDQTDKLLKSSIQKASNENYILNEIRTSTTVEIYRLERRIEELNLLLSDYKFQNNLMITIIVVVVGYIIFVLYNKGTRY